MVATARLCALISALSAAFCLAGCGGGGGGTGTTTPPPVITYSERQLYSFGQAPDGNYPGASMVFDALGNLYGTTPYGGTYGGGTVFKLTPKGGQWTETVLYNFCPAQGCPDGAQPSSSLVFDSAGNLYGTASQGGAYAGSPVTGAGIGVVFELTPQQDGTWAETVLHSFGSGTDGKAPMAGLVFDKSGNLYGTTYQGGTGPQCLVGCGTVFELSPGSNGWTENVLYNFCSQIGCTDGENPTGGVIVDAAGNLYGTTPGGGLSQTLGIVFELIPGTNGQFTESVLYEFQGGDSDGYSPVGALVQDGSGNLYGATEFGYSYVFPPSLNNGTVFKLTRGPNNQWSESIVHGLCAQAGCADGSIPSAGVILDNAGNLYGTTLDGGTSNWGAVFKLVPQNDGTWQESTIYSLQGYASGYSPRGLTLDSSGSMYGVAGGGTSGYGIAFELTPE